VRKMNSIISIRDRECAFARLCKLYPRPFNDTVVSAKCSSLALSEYVEEQSQCRIRQKVNESLTLPESYCAVAWRITDDVLFDAGNAEFQRPCR
jgi:hypothetical protein